MIYGGSTIRYMSTEGVELTPVGVERAHPGKIAALRADVARDRAELRRLTDEDRWLKRKIAALEELHAWWKPDLPQQRAEASRLHSVVAQVRAEGRLLSMRPSAGEDWLSVAAGAVSFVVRHDWAAAFAGAEMDGGGSWRLPYDICCFEFRVAGRPMLAFATHTGGDGSDVVVQILLESSVGWVDVMEIYRYGPGGWRCTGDIEVVGGQRVCHQIEAICIALDARVAVEEAVRQPAALVAARRREGKEPPRDYRVLNLARRSRPLAPVRGGDGTGARRRLHFRRGHWRHYAAGWKTWVRWTLVGDSDLTFIDKHYTL